MRQAQTARDVYHQHIKPQLQARQVLVRKELELFIDHYKVEPTAKELLVFIAARYPQEGFDLNTVRPRLTEMAEQGWVQHTGRRLCTVTRKRVYTWGLSTPNAPPIFPVSQRLQF